MSKVGEATSLREARPDLTERTRLAIKDALVKRRGGWRVTLAMAGPAFVASIAYMDPGNFATNIQAGSGYGYQLLWVVLVANLLAMLFQAMSAKVGIVTGRNLAELSRLYFPRPLVWAMWIVSEVAAMATDLAEFLGGAIGLSLLFGMPLLAGMVVTAIVVYGILLFEGVGFRPLELIIGGLVGVIGIGYLIEVLIARPDWAEAAVSAVWPRLPDQRAAMLAVGIVGATVMPHAIYLHSSLTQNRVRLSNDEERTAMIRYSNREVLVALGFAGVVNMAIVMMASSAFHQGHVDVAEIGTAYHTLGPLLGTGAATIFLITLMASGVSSSAVGTMAGQVIMQGFIDFRIPVSVRRLVTMAPAFLVVGLGYNVTTSLVLSQVVLSLVLPVPILAMLVLSHRRDVMGRFTTRPLTSAAAVLATAVILVLNGILILQVLGFTLPGLAAG